GFGRGARLRYRRIAGPSGLGRGRRPSRLGRVVVHPCGRGLAAAGAPDTGRGARHQHVQRPGDRGARNFGCRFDLFRLRMETQKKRSRTITWEDPFEVMRAAPGRTGLELLRELAAGRLPAPPIAQTMGFTGVSFDEGRAVFEGEAGEYLYNPIGVVHGGYAMTLLDSCMSVAVHTLLGVGERYTTLEAKINFVRPITLDTGRVRAEGTVIHRGNTIATAEGKQTAVSTGTLLAHGTTTCLISLSPPALRPTPPYMAMPIQIVDVFT